MQFTIDGTALGVRLEFVRLHEVDCQVVVRRWRTTPLTTGFRDAAGAVRNRGDDDDESQARSRRRANRPTASGPPSSATTTCSLKADGDDEEIQLSQRRHRGQRLRHAAVVARFQVARRLSHRAGRRQGSLSGRVVARAAAAGPSCSPAPTPLPGDKFTDLRAERVRRRDAEADQAGGRQDRLATGRDIHWYPRRPALHLSTRSTAATSGFA